MNSPISRNRLDGEGVLQAADYLSPGLLVQSDGKRVAVELKFVVDEPLAQLIDERAKGELCSDPFASPETGDYSVSSYYLDTPELDVFHRTKLMKNVKYRFRAYDQGSYLFLERKIRSKGIVSKRRSPVTEPQFESGEALPELFSGEIESLGLVPVCAVHYDRTPYVEPMSQEPFRVTIDRNLKTRYFPAREWESLRGELPWHGTTGDSAGKEASHPYLEGSAVVEFKFTDALPKKLMAWIEDFGLAPSMFSKYRSSMQFHLGPFLPELEGRPS